MQTACLVADLILRKKEQEEMERREGEERGRERNRRKGLLLQAKHHCRQCDQ